MNGNGKAPLEPPRAPLWKRVWMITRQGGSAGWLIVTFLQGLLTWAFIAVSRHSEGAPWENEARLLVMVAIFSTWCMALRTIRARLVELVAFWRRASKGLLKKASESGLHQIPAALQTWQANYVQQSMRRLRLIAAGITLPFFILPIFTAAVCVSVCWNKGQGDSGLLGLALLLSVLAAIVGAYLHWSMYPAPIRVSAGERRVFPVRVRRKKSE